MIKFQSMKSLQSSMFNHEDQYPNILQAWNNMVKFVFTVKGSQRLYFHELLHQGVEKDATSFPWIAPLYPWSLPYNTEC